MTCDRSQLHATVVQFAQTLGFDDDDCHRFADLITSSYIQGYSSASPEQPARIRHANHENDPARSPPPTHSPHGLEWLKHDVQKAFDRLVVPYIQTQLKNAVTCETLPVARIDSIAIERNPDQTIRMIAWIGTDRDGHQRTGIIPVPQKQPAIRTINDWRTLLEDMTIPQSPQSGGSALFHVSAWNRLEHATLGEVITLKPGMQGAEGRGVYFSEGSPRFTAAEGAMRHGIAAVIVIAATNADQAWWQSKGSKAKKFNKPRTWHTANKPITCRIRSIEIQNNVRFLHCDWEFPTPDTAGT